MATVIGCGVFGVQDWRFLRAVAVGGLLYILLYTLLGFFIWLVVLQLIEGIHVPVGLLGSVAPLLLVSVWIARAQRGLHLAHTSDASTIDSPHRWPDGAVAGVLVTILSRLAINVPVVVVGDLTLLAPGDLVERARARLALLALIGSTRSTGCLRRLHQGGAQPTIAAPHLAARTLPGTLIVARAHPRPRG
jgi:hypothetical protein